LLSTSIRGQTQKALVSTHGEKKNKAKKKDTPVVELALCLEKECLEMIKTYLPLCGLHYHQCVSGKCPEVVLKENYGIAKFNSQTQKIDYPSSVPKDRFPLPVSARPRKGLMVFIPPQVLTSHGGLVTCPSLCDDIPAMRRLPQVQRDPKDFSPLLEQAQILPQRRLDPSLRINSGPLPFSQGEGVNRERSALPNNGGIIPLSNGEYFVGREFGGANGEGDIPE
jgi:hypothetical protein